jgi:hypothetical protein
MFVNIIKSYRDVVAICDSELLGKRFEEPFEDVVKQLHVKENFYKGKEGREYSEEELLNLMKTLSKEDSTFNIVGKNSIKIALNSGIIKEDSVGKIKGIPYALVLL